MRSADDKLAELGLKKRTELSTADRHRYEQELANGLIKVSICRDSAYDDRYKRCHGVLPKTGRYFVTKKIEGADCASGSYFVKNVGMSCEEVLIFADKMREMDILFQRTEGAFE